MLKTPNGCGIGSVNFSSFKAMFQWLANCGIEDSVSMHVNVTMTISFNKDTPALSHM